MGLRARGGGTGARRLASAAPARGARALAAQAAAYFLATSGHLLADSGWKASAAGIVARTW